MKYMRALAYFSLLITVVLGKYIPDWNSLDSRPLPQWYDEAKVGIFIHWGVYSVPSYKNEWFWKFWELDIWGVPAYMEKNYPKTFLYPDFAKDFKADLFNATEWAEIFAKSGAKYVVLTSKHHEGYALWPSKYSFNWNAKDVGPGKDLLGELAEAVRKRNLIFGTYYSLMEWYNPLMLSDEKNSFSTQEFVKNKIMPEMIELVETYKPSLFWTDGDGGALDTYWNATGFLAWLYNESPIKDFVVTNDRWGNNTPCIHGGFFTCGDRYNPGVLQQHKWENAMTIDRISWGYRRDARLEDYLTTFELISELVTTVSTGGNILINVGPTKDGVIPPIFQDRLKGLGEWLGINGEAIYGSKPWSVQNDTSSSGVWYTSKNNALYAIVLFWPDNNILELASPFHLVDNNQVQITMLGLNKKIQWFTMSHRVNIMFPDKSTVKSTDAYVFKIEIST